MGLNRYKRGGWKKSQNAPCGYFCGHLVVRIHKKINTSSLQYGLQNESLIHPTRMEMLCTLILGKRHHQESKAPGIVPIDKFSSPDFGRQAQ